MAKKQPTPAAPKPFNRVFKTAWFEKAARKASISDKELCEAIREVQDGKCDDLGGGVFKKRLNKNAHRALVLAKGGRWWIYAYIFAKKDQANISPNELLVFKKIAEIYRTLDENSINRSVTAKDLMEICYGREEKG